MKQFLSVLSSNQINKYGIKIPANNLELALNQSWNFGVPTCISHDSHRPAAWSQGLSLYIESDLVRFIGLTHVPENNKDSEKISDSFRGYLSKKIEDNLSEYEEELRSKIEHHLSGEEVPSMVGDAAFIDIGLAERVFPDIFDEEDKDGLVFFDNLTPKAPGVFEKNGLLLFAHPFFRRSLSRYNSLNSPFLQTLQNINENTELPVKIALDKNMIGLASSYEDKFEFEYWWGPKFSDDLNSNSLGVARHEADERHKLFYGISRTEFRWYIQDEKKTFECEELKDIPSLGVDNDSFGCRFIHSMVDPSENKPIHIDGAIRMYDEESMIYRLDTDLGRSGRQTDYTKLWRIDGSLKVSHWKELVTHYYRDNRLVGEYLGAEEDSENLEPHIILSTETSSSLEDYVPCNMEKGQGIKISMSYHPQSQGTGRQISVLDSFTYNSQTYNYIESDTIEIIKVLNRMGEELRLPNEKVKLIIFEDLSINFPLINHYGNNAIGLANKTQEAILKLCNKWLNKGQDRVITYNIGIQYKNKDVYFSIAGHIFDIFQWLKQPESKFPSEVDKIGEWCKSTLDKLYGIFGENNKKVELKKLLKLSGILQYERKFLEPDEYKIFYNEKLGRVDARLKILKENTDLINLLKNGNLQVATSHLMGDSECSKCHKSYLKCGCSKYLDEDVVQIPKDIEFLPLFWTNRKA
ncbi:hypothetical protein SAMN05192551_1194 [Tindallia magadiensis]|uniref:Uncharacterized protein n=1 Tax=Tindallia magadiensis TaxID=69895 RepID=A0A1I3HZM9_9FIRM|nr:hypothetical protein [Tindallia magadiensis]SFI41196.1 hypothetical protein SAMN05192551_1194 [Tindallia magadiensis]